MFKIKFLFILLALVFTTIVTAEPTPPAQAGTQESGAVDQDHPTVDCPPPGGQAGESTDPSSQTEAGADDITCPPAKDPHAKQYDIGRLAFWFKNYKRAMEFWQPLAEDGYAPAQTSLGWMYQNGIGIKQDYQQAVTWYTKAAEQGFDQAQTNLGILYEFGQGIEQDYAQAFHWYQLASEQNYRFAHYNLGILYLNGKGVTKDRQKAIDLFFKAYEQDVEEAAAMLKSLGIEVYVKEKKQHRSPPPTHTMPAPGMPVLE